ncbi:hypothetical protein SNOG_14333 [Parastagonospora nodorum SN15]|uniref:Uncharacterized protein n=1 Tax=Phaeosphaeria nodorum (strain SN15 / ATCC MYA-4574 / FGSC 10173) TaxID=321614 RepID=Q0U1E9_PHANO|nr:hypothetical protein SNOG_14333 [Parastagonospora nodorum SN15]EAT78204.1 hypothetical protein SNOG_14333 [Parastagonospora nodorum SN15]
MLGIDATKLHTKRRTFKEFNFSQTTPKPQMIPAHIIKVYTYLATSPGSPPKRTRQTFSRKRGVNEVGHGSWSDVIPELQNYILALVYGRLSPDVSRDTHTYLGSLSVF